MTRFILAVILFAVTASVNATILDGNTLNYQYYFDNLGSPWAGADNGNKVVGAGLEVSNVAENKGTMDIFDNGFYVDYTDATFWGPAAYNGFVLTDVGNAIADFTTFNYTLDTNMGGLTLASLNITENGLGINWQNLSFDANTYVKLTMSAVPIPAAVWLFGTALIGLVGFGKRRKAA